jgi:NitT/TauT family transport system permease protein
VLQAVPEEIRNGRLVAAVGDTVAHCVVGLAIAWILSLGLSTLIHRSNLTRDTILPILKISSGVPPIAAFPLLLLLFRLGPWSIIALASLGAFISMTLGIYAAQLQVRSEIPVTLSRLGYSRRGVWCLVMSAISERLSVVGHEGLRWVLILAVVGEMHGAVAGGIGAYIDSGRSNGDYPLVYLGMLACAALSLVAYSGMSQFGRILHSRLKTLLLS